MARPEEDSGRAMRGCRDDQPLSGTGGGMGGGMGVGVAALGVCRLIVDDFSIDDLGILDVAVRGTSSRGRSLLVAILRVRLGGATNVLGSCLHRQ